MALPQAATAIYVHTESGDDYLFCEPHPMTPELLTTYLLEVMSEEFAYIGNLMVAATGYEAPSTKHAWEAINAMEQEW